MRTVKTFIALAILLSLQSPSWAKDNKFLWATVEVGRGWGIADFGNPDNSANSNEFGKMYSISSAYKTGCYFWNQTSLGIGASAVNYYRPDLNLQVIGFVDIRHDFERYPNTFAYVDAGIPFATSEPVLLHSNFLTNIGAGYKLMFTERMSLNILVEYSVFFYMLQNETGDTNSCNRHSLSLLLGWEF
jgi:hypothetical protein